MITTSNGNQYLRPDYLTPLPTTLDAKKSPLALLAQTCSQIGADTSSTKPSQEKQPAKKEQPREKASPVGSANSPAAPKAGFKPYESEEKPRAKTPAKKEQAGSPRASPGGKTPQREAPSPGKSPLAGYLYPDLLRSPYLSYPGRPKPECRDPYCGGCHLVGGKGCPAGCAQCEKAALLPAFAHAHLAALAASAQPYLCSWIGADATYCGKRFANSEELLQHLRSHTSDPLHPLLHRTYPTPPLSPLATARYHPYSKPHLLPPSLAAAPFQLPPHPLPPYFSPYSLYGPRLGATHP